MTTQTRPASSPKPQPRRLTIFAHALAFVLGFSLVFVFGWGGSAALLGQLFEDYKRVMATVGGVVVILFGLYNMGLLQSRWLSMDTRPQWTMGKRGGLLASLLMGMFFAAGWSPCIGTTFAAILALAANEETVSQAMWLASGYALGLGLPFLILGLGFVEAVSLTGALNKHTQKFQMASGILLVLMGVLLLTNNLVTIAAFAQRNGLAFEFALGGSATPNYLLAVGAGVLSFFAPCVLPLVPAYLGYLSAHATHTA